MKHTNPQGSKSAEEILISYGYTGFIGCNPPSDILKAMEEYADQFRNQSLPAAPAQGEREVYVWVKASERLPTKGHNYHVKVWSERHKYYYNDTNHFEKGSFAPIPNCPTDYVIEWLELQTQAPALPVQGYSYEDMQKAIDFGFSEKCHHGSIRGHEAEDFIASLTAAALPVQPLEKLIKWMKDNNNYGSYGSIYHMANEILNDHFKENKGAAALPVHQWHNADHLRTEFELHPPFEFAAENYWEVYAGWLEGKFSGDGWVSVEDEPKEEGEYLCLRMNNFGFSRFVADYKLNRWRNSGELCGADEDGIKGCWVDKMNCAVLVTHWQPLPLPPITK